MANKKNTRRRSAAFPLWSFGLLIGFLLVLLWKRKLDEQRRGQMAYPAGEPPKITLEEVDRDAPTAGPVASAPPPPPAAEEPQETAPKKKDDLRKIEGIGPKVQEKLFLAGVQTYAQLGRASQKKLKGILEEAGYGYMDPGSWPEQAKLAAKGDWDGLSDLKARLKGGRAG